MQELKALEKQYYGVVPRAKLDALKAKHGVSDKPPPPPSDEPPVLMPHLLLPGSSRLLPSVMEYHNGTPLTQVLLKLNVTAAVRTALASRALVVGGL